MVLTCIIQLHSRLLDRSGKGSFNYTQRIASRKHDSNSELNNLDLLRYVAFDHPCKGLQYEDRYKIMLKACEGSDITVHLTIFKFQ